MNFRVKVAAWFAFSVLVLLGTLIITAHTQLDEELRKDRTDRTHPKVAGWGIHGSYTNEEVEDILGELLRIWLVVAVPLVIVSAGVGYIIAVRSIRPIRQINRELAGLHFRSPDLRVHSPENDRELLSLAEHVNALLGRLERSYHEMADFSAQVAHELRTPLTLMRMRLESAAAGLPADFSEEMQESLRCLSRLVERSLLTARAEGGKLETQNVRVDLTALLEDLQDGYRHLANERSMELRWQVAAALDCDSDPDLLRQIFHNLLGNAIRHGQGRMCVEASRFGKRIVIKIANTIEATPPGISSTGMGLRLVQSLAQALEQVRFAKRQTAHLFVTRFSLPCGTLSPLAL